MLENELFRSKLNLFALAKMIKKKIVLMILKLSRLVNYLIKAQYISHTIFQKHFS